LESDDTHWELKCSLDLEIDELARLVLAINRTNNETILAGTALTIMEALVIRESLKTTVLHYGTIIPKIRPRTEKDNYAPLAEPVVYELSAGVDPVAMKAQYNEAAKKLRELDNLLQAANWTVDVVGI
jgi:hypothetical protein